MSRVETEQFYHAINSSGPLDRSKTVAILSDAYHTMGRCLLLFRVFFALLSLLLTSTAAQGKSFNPSTATCSAPVRTQLEAAPLSRQQQDLLEKILPQPTSQKPAVRGELRAPFHIPCQLASFPHLQQFVDNVRQYGLSSFEVKQFAQPPHLIFFDENQNVVQTIIVSPAWTGFELRDLVREIMMQ